MKRFYILVLFASVLGGCANYPVSQGLAYEPLINQAPVAKVCDPSGWYCRPGYAAPTPMRPPIYYYPSAPVQPWSFFYWHR